MKAQRETNASCRDKGAQRCISRYACSHDRRRCLNIVCSVKARLETVASTTEGLGEGAERSHCRSGSSSKCHSRIPHYPEVIHLPVTRTGDNYIMFLGEKELITDRDRTRLLGPRISAPLPVSLGVTSRLMFYFSFLHFFFPRFATWVAVEVLLAP
jgi:hypothetical protein